MESFKKELTQINEKLSKVLTKNDPSLKTMIKEIITEMKVELLKSVQHWLDVLEGNLFEKERENDALKEKIKLIEREVEDQKEENERLKAELVHDKEDTSEKINDLEQYSRRNNIRLTGIGEAENEDEMKSSELVIETLNMKIPNLNLQKGDIDIAHRLGRKEPNKSRQIIVKFMSRVTRDKILKSKKNLKGSSVYVNEDLTEINQLVLSCLRKKMTDEVETAWTRGGKLFFRNKLGSVHQVTYKEYNHWIDLPWPASGPRRR